MAKLHVHRDRAGDHLCTDDECGYRPNSIRSRQLRAALSGVIGYVIVLSHFNLLVIAAAICFAIAIMLDAFEHKRKAG